MREVAACGLFALWIIFLLGGSISYHSDECSVLEWDSLAHRDVLAPSKGWATLYETEWARVSIGGYTQGFKIHFNQGIYHSFNSFNEWIPVGLKRFLLIILGS